MDQLKDLLEWAKGLTGLVMMVILAVLGGKTWRANRIDAARTDVQVAELNGERQEAELNASSLTKMEAKLDAQGKQIDLLLSEVTKLKADVHHLLSTNRTAVDLLEEIVISADDSSNAILLRTAIKHLRNADATYGFQPPPDGN